jgi:hypothetical protein
VLASCAAAAGSEVKRLPRGLADAQAASIRT